MGVDVLGTTSATVTNNTFTALYSDGGYMYATGGGILCFWFGIGCYYYPVGNAGYAIAVNSNTSSPIVITGNTLNGIGTTYYTTGPIDPGVYVHGGYARAINHTGSVALPLTTIPLAGYR